MIRFKLAAFAALAMAAFSASSADACWFSCCGGGGYGGGYGCGQKSASCSGGACNIGAKGATYCSGGNCYAANASAGVRYVVNGDSVAIGSVVTANTGETLFRATDGQFYVVPSGTTSENAIATLNSTGLTPGRVAQSGNIGIAAPVPDVPSRVTGAPAIGSPGLMLPPTGSDPSVIYTFDRTKNQFVPAGRLGTDGVLRPLGGTGTTPPNSGTTPKPATPGTGTNPSKDKEEGDAATLKPGVPK